MTSSGIQLRERTSRAGIIPNPMRFEPHDGQFVIDGTVSISCDGRAAFAADVLAVGLSDAGVDAASSAGPADIALIVDDALGLGPEGYRVDIRPSGIDITGTTEVGVFYGVQSLLQLIPAEGPIEVACAVIEDRPRFAWRGVMLDVSRHFMPIAFLRKMVDLLAMHKMNTLHLHLTDDQGWRIEIKKYPRLTEVGGRREKTLIGHLEHTRDAPVFDDVPHEGYYTQDELRELVAYAAARGVTLVPEIEMPGHAQAAIAAYPELGVHGDSVDVCPTWGIIEHIFNPFETTLDFLRDVLMEVMDIFPSKFIHIGGDEAVKTQWKSSERVQARIRELGLRDEDEMQSYIVSRMSEFLAEHGRRLIGWDEIIEGGLAENAAVMSWRGESGGLTAAAAGHDVVMAPVGFTYLDLYQTRDLDKEPVAQGGFLPLNRVYEYEPIPEGLNPDNAHHVLGTQAQLWTEYMPTPDQVEYMAFPRLSALAEVAWSDRDRRHYDEFVDRLMPMLARLNRMQVKYRSLSMK